MFFTKYGTVTLSTTINSALPYFSTGDFNADGYMDLVFHAVSPWGFTSNPPLSVYTQPTILTRSGNSFSDSTHALFGGNPYQGILPSYLRVADFNKDGFPDLFSSDYGIDPYDNTATIKTGAKELIALSNNGILSSTTLPSPDDSVTHSNAIGDIDNDGDIDIILVETVQGVTSKSKSAFLINKGNGSFDYRTELLPADVLIPNVKYLSAGFGDLNRDGNIDLVLGAAYGTYNNLVILNPGNGDFSKGEKIPLPLPLFSSPIFSTDQKRAATTLTMDIIVKDFNRDGLNDIALSETFSDSARPDPAFYRGASIQLLMNSLSGFVDKTSTQISNLQINNNSNFFYCLNSVDVDGDHDFDIIAYRSETGTGKSGYSSYIFKNDGKGFFQQDNMGMPISGLLIPLSLDDIPSYNFAHLDYFLVGNEGKYGKWSPTVTLWQLDQKSEILRGQALHDTFIGTEVNDNYVGLGSNDLLDGKSGIDTAFFRGKKDEYTVTISTNGKVIVKDQVLNRDGEDTLINFERVWFSDKTIATDINGNAGQAYRLYQAALDRTPDERGLAGWIKFMDEGGSLTAMSQQFIDSQEFKTKYGALDNTKFVNQLYLNVLDRNGEPAGIAGWVNGLANGLSRAEVLKGFSESSENQANVIGQIKNGIPYVEWWLA